MSTLIPKNQPTTSVAEENLPNSNSTEDQDDPENPNSITSHLYLRPIHTSQTLDKEVVLRRIRHRKRMNKVRSALQGLLNWPSSITSTTDKVSECEKKWVDDAFAAP